LDVRLVTGRGACNRRQTFDDFAHVGDAAASDVDFAQQDVDQNANDGQHNDHDDPRDSRSGLSMRPQDDANDYRQLDQHVNDDADNR
jgi:hypothetical protein